MGVGDGVGTTVGMGVGVGIEFGGPGHVRLSERELPHLDHAARNVTPSPYTRTLTPTSAVLPASTGQHTMVLVGSACPAVYVALPTMPSVSIEVIPFGNQ